MSSFMGPVEKKQQTLSSFFKKPSTLSGNPTKTNGVVARAEYDDFELPIAKKRRIITDTDVSVHSDLPADLANVNENQKLLHNLRTANDNESTVDPVANGTSVGNRASRYIFSSSLADEDKLLDHDDALQQKKKAELHRKFVKRLGKPDSITEIKRRNRALFDEENEDPENDNADDDEVDDLPKHSTKSRPGLKKSSNKLTPMERQVIDIKKAHMDTLLVVEVGYKFRFFGEDARVAAKELGIVCIPGKYRYDEHSSEAHLDRFASASIPVHRLHVHVKRLVGAGHKVGVVRQLETAALKAVGDNRNTPFVRKLTNLYTKGTYIDDIERLEDQSTDGGGSGSGNSRSQPPSTGYLLCLTEVNEKGYGNDEKVHVGIVAVQPATGDIIYDDFEDGFMRSEIESRLLHIAPCELLIVGTLSSATDRLVMHLSTSKSNVFGDKIRVERITKQKTIAAQAHNHISNFYSQRLIELQEDQNKAAKMLEKVSGFPENVTVCLSSMITHLSDYGLEHIFDLTKYFQPFSARSHMLLNGNTLASLEIYQNQTDYTVKGSLFWTLDRTNTRFGGRLLRTWVGRPLLDIASIRQRQSAIKELLDPNRAVHVEKLKHVLAKLKGDLEKSLIRIYYGKCARSELVTVLKSLQFLASEFGHVSDPGSSGFDSPLISTSITSLPAILSDVVFYLDKINLEAAKSDDKYNFFLPDEETKDITEHKFGIASVEHDLETFRTTAAEKLGKKRAVDYVVVAGIDYLIEVENSSATIRKVPASWTKISGTKKVSRFHPPEIVKLIRERDQHKESLAAACDAAFKDLLAHISSKYQSFRDAIQALATLDCLLSLATVAAQPGYIEPTFSNDTRIEIEGGRHPMIEQLLLDAYVPNNATMSHDSTRSLLVTGPNMGGKSSYVRSVALIAVMAQIGSYVPAVSANMGIFDAVFTRMGAFDNMMSGESTFMVELSETSDILKAATNRSLVILDELGRGTSTHDGVAIAASVLDWLVREKKCLTFFITHYQLLARMADGWPNGELKNVHMRFTEEPDKDNVTFLYEVGEGVAHRSYGLNVARLANIDENVIDLARDKSSELELKTCCKKIEALARFLKGNETLDEDRIDAITDGIEQL